jgi:hypothetical protein
MRSKFVVIGVAVAVCALFTWAQETPKDMAATYDSLADSILGLKRTEANFVRALLDGHRHGAEAHMKAGQWEQAAAEISLWANEGDNKIGGVRKRLLEGGHHHNADGEAKGIYEPGYVIVTRKAKQDALAAAAAVRTAGTDVEKKKAWQDFIAVVESLSKSD